MHFSCAPAVLRGLRELSPDNAPKLEWVPSFAREKLDPVLNPFGRRALDVSECLVEQHVTAWPSSAHMGEGEEHTEGMARGDQLKIICDWQRPRSYLYEHINRAGLPRAVRPGRCTVRTHTRRDRHVL